MIDVMTQIEVMADISGVELTMYTETCNYKHDCVLRGRSALLNISQHSSSINNFYLVKLVSNSVTKRSTIKDVDKLLTYVDMFCKQYGNGE